MIKDSKKAERIFKHFQRIPIPVSVKRQVEKNRLPHYVFYYNRGKAVECHCTHCKKDYEVKINQWHFKHNDKGKCRKCGKSIEYKSRGMSRKSLRTEYNITFFKAKDNKLYIRCYLVEQSFSNKEQNMDAHVEYIEKARYYLEKGLAHKWRTEWYYSKGEYVLVSQSSETEPIFKPQGMGWNTKNNNDYESFDLHEIEKTFLKKEYSQYHRFADSIVSYLCYFSKHPNLENLQKGGYFELAKCKFYNSICQYINWRSNDLKRMLRLNTEEVKLLRDRDVRVLQRYYNVRDMFPSFTSVADRLRIAKEYDGYRSLELIDEMAKKTKLSVLKVDNYITRQKKLESYSRISKSTVLNDWKDYIGECEALGYDIESERINKPKDLHAKHAETSRMLVLKANAEKDRQAMERSKKLNQLELINDELGLMAIVPKSASEIIFEGQELDHCVGSYADKHIKGECTIVFFRKISEKEKPFYTVELSNDLKLIRQCRGYKNDYYDGKYHSKPLEVGKFESLYSQHLKSIKKKSKQNQKIKIAV